MSFLVRNQIDWTGMQKLPAILLHCVLHNVDLYQGARRSRSPMVSSSEPITA